jgi:hypothetical protein
LDAVHVARVAQAKSARSMADENHAKKARYEFFQFQSDGNEYQRIGTSLTPAMLID